MKKLCLLMLALCGASTTISAQVKVPEPEFAGQVVLLTSDSTGIQLEDEKSEMKIKSSMFGMIPLPGTSLLDKTKMTARFKGLAAKVTTKAGPMKFIIRAEKNDIDLSKVLQIAKLNVKKKYREWIYGECGIIGGSNVNLGGNIKCTAHRYGNSSYIVEVDNVTPGQYAIAYSAEMLDAATFGVE